MLVFDNFSAETLYEHATTWSERSTGRRGWDYRLSKFQNSCPGLSWNLATCCMLLCLCVLPSMCSVNQCVGVWVLPSMCSHRACKGTDWLRLQTFQIPEFLPQRKLRVSQGKNKKGDFHTEHSTSWDSDIPRLRFQLVICTDHTSHDWYHGTGIYRCRARKRLGWASHY